MDNTRQSLNLPNIAFGYVGETSSKTDRNLWAVDERQRITEGIQRNNEVQEEDWSRLRVAILSLLRESLATEKLSLWQQMQTNLESLVPLQDLVRGDKEIASLLRAAMLRVRDSPEWANSLPGLTDSVQALLPPEQRQQCPPVDPDEVAVRPIVRLQANKKGPPSTAIVPSNDVVWFQDALLGDLFDPATIGLAGPTKPSKIKIRDILSSIGTVGTEIILSESAFERPLENMIKAMNIDMSVFGYRDICDIDLSLQRKEEEVNLNTNAGVRASVVKRGMDSLPLPKNGREGVVYMIKSRHMREMRLAYFNVERRRVRDFYALVAVTRFQVEKEHFIFSSVGVIHRLPDGTGLAISLTDWYRESMLYSALRCIPFIKTFLCRKHFQSWLKVTVRNRHRRKVRFLERRLPMANTVFGKSMLQVLKLLAEVSTVSLVPKALEHTHTEMTFLREFSYISETADGFLEKFYRYIKLVVDETAAESYKHLQFCQAQVNNIYTYSDDCIYKKRLKQEERQKALRRSMNQVSQLGDFVRLVNYLLTTTVVDITLHNVFILAEMLCSPKIGTRKEAVFRTNLVIKTVKHEEGVLSYSPTVAEVEDMFKGTVIGIPRLILRHCFPLEGLLSQKYLCRFRDEIRGSTSDAPDWMEYGHGEEDFGKLELPHIDLPTKGQDDLRVATPPFVNPNILNKNSFVVFGKAMPSKFTPMSRSNVFDILDSNPLYKELIMGFEDLFKETMVQMEALCKDHEWLLDVRCEYQDWSSIDMEAEWKDLSPYLFEQRLLKVKSFLLHLQCAERAVAIPSQVFVVSLTDLLEELTSEMELELESVFQYVLRRARTLGSAFIDEITAELEVLRLRSSDAETFTRVIMHIVECREHIGRHQTAVDYIKSLFDVLRVSDKVLIPTDRDLEDQVASLWESFVFQLQEANDFVNGDKENVIFAVKNRIQELEDSAKAIDLSLHDPIFCSLIESCSNVLIKINEKMEDMESIRSESEKLMVCFKTLQGEYYDRTVDMSEVISNVYFIRRLWGLLAEAKDQIEVWKTTLFSQFDVSAAADVVLGWQRSIEDMRSQRGGDHEVVREIDDVVSDFASFMTLFGKMSSPLMQLEHWQRFFTEIGHPFVDPFEKLTVGDLMALDLRRHVSVVDVIFNDAVLRQKAVADLEQRLGFWMAREFEFAAHDPEPWFRRRRQRKTKKSAAEQYYEEKRLATERARLEDLPFPDSLKEDVVLVAGWPRLFEDLADSLITLRWRAGGHGPLQGALEDLQGVAGLLRRCQDKWLLFSRMFSEEFFVVGHRKAAETFRTVDRAFLAVLSELRDSPGCLGHTAIGKRFLGLDRSQDLSGTLTGLLATLDGLQAPLDAELAHARDVFPRLHFVPDGLLCRVLGCRVSAELSEVAALLPACFPSVGDLAVAGGVLSVVGRSGEVLRLPMDGTSSETVPRWLRDFERALRGAVRASVRTCLSQQQQESRPERPASTVFQEVAQIETLASKVPLERQAEAGQLVHEVLAHYQSWLARHPLQAVLLAEEVVFSKRLREGLSDGVAALRELRERLLEKERVLVRLLLEGGPRAACERMVLAADVHLNVVEGLLADEVPSPTSFLYQAMVRYEEGPDGRLWVRAGDTSLPFDHEYVDEGASPAVVRPSSERCLLGMLQALSGHWVATGLGSPGTGREAASEVARVLGRPLFAVCCEADSGPDLVSGYLEGALSSGGLLLLDGLERLAVPGLSRLSRDLWLVRRRLHANEGFSQPLPTPIRGLSAASRLLDADEDDVLDVTLRTAPHTDRSPYQRHKTMTSHNILEISLDRGKTWPEWPLDDSDLLYFPTMLAQIRLYKKLVDIRYGFGVMATISEKFDIERIPESMKSQLRSHSLVAVEETLFLRPYLILAGHDHHQELEGCIHLFLERLRGLLPDFARHFRSLLPRIISNSEWIKDDCISDLGRFIYSMIVHKFAPDPDHDVLIREAVVDCFHLDGVDLDSSLDNPSALEHQLKSQLRARGLEVSEPLIGKMVKLRNTIRDHKVTYLLGEASSGKTTCLEVLTAAVNGLYSSAGRILSGPRRRGILDVLRAISVGRRVNGESESHRVHLWSLCLEEIGVDGVASTLEPWLQAAGPGGLEVWLHVDHLLGDWSQSILALESLLEDDAVCHPCVRVVVEQGLGPLPPFLRNWSLRGLVRLDGEENRWREVLRRAVRDLLAAGLISHFGCQLLAEGLEGLLDSLFFRLQLPLECAKDPGLRVVCATQSAIVLELMLLEASKHSVADVGDLEQRYQCLAAFSLIQGARGTLYSSLVGQGLLSVDELEGHLVVVLRDRGGLEGPIEGPFGLAVDFEGLCLRPLSTMRGEEPLTLWTDADGMAGQMLRLLVRQGQPVRLRGDRGNLDGILATIQPRGRLHLTQDVPPSDLRVALASGGAGLPWAVVAGEDPLLRPGHGVLLLETFGEGPPPLVEALLPFAMERGRWKKGGPVPLLAEHGPPKTPSSKAARGLLEMNLLPPSLAEARRLVQAALVPWLRTAEGHRQGSAVLLARGIADLLVEVVATIRQARVTAICVRPGRREALNQASWAQIRSVVAAVTVVPLSRLQESVRSLEVAFPIEKGEVLKRNKLLGLYVRVIRQTVYELSREFLDRMESAAERDAMRLLLQDGLKRHLCGSVSVDVDEMLLKHFPVAVARMTDITLWPCRLLMEESHGGLFRPAVEAHNWRIQETGLETLFDGSAGLARMSVVVTDILGLLRHASGPSLRSGVVLARLRSRLIPGRDLGRLLARLMQAHLLRPEDLLDRNEDFLAAAVALAGRAESGRVLLHLDADCLAPNNALLASLARLLAQDSTTSISGVLAPPGLPSSSSQEIRTARAFLRRARANLRLLVTYNGDFTPLETVFLEAGIGPVFLGEYGVEETLAASENALGHQVSQLVVSKLAAAHRGLEGTMEVGGDHLKLAGVLYPGLLAALLSQVETEVASLVKAATAVDTASTDLQDLLARRTGFQDALRSLGEQVEASAREAAALRDGLGGALLQCRGQEQRVAQLFGPLDEMKERSRTNFDEVSPTYMAALETIRNLDPDALEEIKTYARPPQQVRDLIGAVFRLLGYEDEWETIKERMVKINLYEELLYLDKDHISDERYKDLEETLLDPRLQPEYLEGVSKAAASLSRWMQAVYKYSSLNKEINPQLGELLSCQDQINRAQSELGKMRVRAEVMRQDLERKMVSHKELLAKRKTVADSLKDVNYRISGLSNLLSDIGPHCDRWKRKIEILEKERKNLPYLVLGMIIRAVYLDKLPHGLRRSMTDLFDHEEPKVMDDDHLRLLREQDYLELLQENAWTQVCRDQLDTAVELCAVVACPSLSFPNLGSMVMIHCYNGGWEGAAGVVSAALGSSSLWSRLWGPDEPREIHRCDCGERGLPELEKLLAVSAERGDILLVERVHLLQQPPPGLGKILRGDGPSTAHPRFRLLLVTEDGLRGERGSCGGLLHSDRMLHFDLSVAGSDLIPCLQEAVIGVCEPDLLQGLRQCGAQRAEIHLAWVTEEERLVRAASTERAGPSALHTEVLEVDSALLALKATQDGLRDRERLLRDRAGQYGPMAARLCLLLENLGIRPEEDGLLTLSEAIAFVKAVCGSHSHAFTETLLGMLQIAIDTGLIGILAARTDPVDIRDRLLAFAVDLGLREEEGLPQAESAFLRRALLCQDAAELKAGLGPDLGPLPTCSLWSEELITLSLLLETNIVTLAGLTESFTTNGPLWQEYFKFLFLNCNHVPGFYLAQQPGLLLKAAIWRVLNPDKLEEVRRALIAEAFGEDPFLAHLDRRSQWLPLVTSCPPSRPIIVSTPTRSSKGTPSPLAEIAAAHKALATSCRILVFDCASPSEIDPLLSPEGDTDEAPRLCQLLAGAAWVVLVNVHLGSRPLLPVILGLAPRRAHPSSRLFLTMETEGYPWFPPSVLATCCFYRCGPVAAMAWEEETPAFVSSRDEEDGDLSGASSLYLEDQSASTGVEAAFQEMASMLMRALRAPSTRDSAAGRVEARTLLDDLLSLAVWRGRSASAVRVGPQLMDADFIALRGRLLLSNGIVPPDWSLLGDGTVPERVEDFLQVLHTRVKRLCSQETLQSPKTASHL